MSLIDDALKRAQAAGQPEPAGTTAPRPWTPAPLPDAGPARRRRLARILAAGVGIVVAASAGVWLLRRTPAPQSSPPPSRDSPAAETAAVTAPPLATALPAEAAPTTEVVAKARPTRPPAAPVGDPGTAAAENTVADPPVPRPQALANGKTYSGSVTLPGGAKIELGGIVWSEVEPRALLNDRVAGVGAWVEGFTVAKIEPERVVLEKDGLTVFLSLK